VLEHHLVKEGYNVSRAIDGHQALSLLNAQGFDLIILDIMMPDIDGYEVCRRIRRKGIKTPIIFLSAKTAEFDEILGLEIGADDFIRKPFSVKTFRSRVKALLRRKGSSETSPDTIRIRGIEIQRSSYTVFVDGKKVKFPRREFELLAFLAANPNKVFSRNLLLNQVWSDEVYVIDRSVDVHINRIRKKLTPYRDILETVVGIGYRWNTG